MKRLFTTLLVLLLAVTAAQAQTVRKHLPGTTPKTAVSPMTKTFKAMPKQARKDGTSIATFPYINSFEDGTLGGWHTVDADNDGLSWTAQYLFAYGAGNNESDGFASSASYDNDTYTALTPDNWLISPRIDIPAGTSLTLSWYAAAEDFYYPADVYSVYVATDSNIASFTTAAFSETLSTDVFTKHSVSLADYAGQSVYVAFRHHNCSDQFVMKIDDIAIASAGAPDIALSMPSLAFAGDTVSLAATLLDGATSGLTYTWTIQGADIATASTPTVDVVWNAPGTFSVQCVAANNFGADTVSGTITILNCSAITSFPYNESFSAGLGCWISYDADADGHSWFTYDDPDNPGTSWVISESYSDQSWLALTPDNWLISPAIQLPASGNFELSWDVAPITPDYPNEYYAVYVSASGTALSDFTDSLFAETLSDYTTFVHRVASLEAYAGQTIHVAFRHYNCTDQYALVLGNIAVTTAGAPTVTVTGPAKARTSDIVTFSAQVVSSSSVSYAWTVPGATIVANYDTAISVQFAEPGSYAATLVVSNEFGSDTDSSSIYIIDCPSVITAPFAESFDEGFECWGNLDIDGDGYQWESLYQRFQDLGLDDAITSYTHSGSDAAVSWSYYPTDYSAMGVSGTSLDAYDILVTPAIELASDQTWTLTFHAMSFSGEYPDDIEVRLALYSPASLDAFTVTLVPSVAVSADGFVMYEADLSAYAGSTVYLGFVHHTSDMFGLILDDVAVTNEPLSILQPDMPQVSVYPNPATSSVRVAANNIQRLELLDHSGRLLLAKRCADLSDDTTLDISTLPAGVYLLRVYTPAGTAVSKVVKK